MNAKLFSGKVALITGGGKGIGQATALEFAKLGAFIVINGRSKPPLEETAAQVEKEGGKVIIVVGDVADAAVQKATVDKALQAFGRLDFAVNNAGISPWVGTTAECSFEDWKRVIDTNLNGTWLGMKYQIPAIIQSGGGSIVNMTSVAALMTFEGYSPYSASKWGIVGITKVAAKEYASKAVRVNAIAPGSIATPLFQEVINSTPNSKEDYQKQVPMSRIAESHEVATVASFLCSDAASYVTGAVLPVDGGMTL
jgi:NAD(P)-dependent dehydrogenase (short-subunit alcohol dehydrogenase family)